MRNEPTPMPTDYFTWLCELIHVDFNDRSYHLLAMDLHNKTFFWSVPNDDNRGEEGKNLREQYFEIHDIPYNSDYFIQDASMLEVLIALAHRCDELTVDQEFSMKLYEWFWKLISNIGLEDCTDEYYYNIGVTEYVDKILDKIIYRTYRRNGGLFPLTRPKKDQRKVELWYQMCAYMAENYYPEVVDIG